MASDLDSIAEEIKALDPVERLRLAIALLEARKADMAYAVLRMTTDELGAALTMARLAGRLPR